MHSISDDDFAQIAKIVRDTCGIIIPHVRQPSVEARLSKRLRSLSLTSFAEYVTLVRRDEGEREQMIDLLTTNLTRFFREPRHFEFITQSLLPQWHTRGGSINCWSAACSSGEEPYTLSIHLQEQEHRISEFRILATDISRRMLSSAKIGIYLADQVQDVSESVKSRYFKKSIKRGETFYSVNSLCRSPVRFLQLNLLSRWPTQGPFEVILCRNVMLYFDDKTRVSLADRFRQALTIGGILIIGQSESLSDQVAGLHCIEPSIYVRTA